MGKAIAIGVGFGILNILATRQVAKFSLALNESLAKRKGRTAA